MEETEQETAKIQEENSQSAATEADSQLDENVEEEEDIEEKVGENKKPVKEEDDIIESEDTPSDEPEPETIESVKVAFKKELSEKNEKYIRLVAEFENYKKRMTQDMQTRFKFASQPLALNIISGLDNLERALAHAQEEENEQLDEFITGIKMVQQQLFDALKSNNIERVFPQGERFDPNFHEAMGVIETDEIEPDHIAMVFQAGYVYHDRVIRPSMVQVAKKK